ncbi:hypothetical protein [Celeribacter arenosi]|uniref:Porin n=1 Tax=Celeribacter arenosi TaxID=792649 RepID=A0ABP7KHJ6_9RHOB
MRYLLTAASVALFTTPAVALEFSKTAVEATLTQASSDGVTENVFSIAGKASFVHGSLFGELNAGLVRQKFTAGPFEETAEISTSSLVIGTSIAGISDVYARASIINASFDDEFSDSETLWGLGAQTNLLYGEYGFEFMTNSSGDRIYTIAAALPITDNVDAYGYWRNLDDDDPVDTQYGFILDVDRGPFTGTIGYLDLDEGDKLAGIDMSYDLSPKISAKANLARYFEEDPVTFVALGLGYEVAPNASIEARIGQARPHSGDNATVVGIAMRLDTYDSRRVVKRAEDSFSKISGNLFTNAISF